MVQAMNLIEGRLELAGLRVHRELIHHSVVHHDRQTVDESFFGDGFGLGGRKVQGTGGGEPQPGGECCGQEV